METKNNLSLKRITIDHPLKICFVCLGNICRSPTAEGVFQHLVDREKLSAYIETDSAGTSAYHTGEPANSKSKMVARQHGVKLQSKARKFDSSDFEYFDLIIAMDKENLHDLRHLDRNNKYHDKIFLLRDFDPIPGDKEVPDPYYDGVNGFELVFDIIRRSSEELLALIKNRTEL